MYLKLIAMKRLYTLLTFAVVLVLVMSSCSSSRNTQNTDDIYYSSGGKKTTAAKSSSNNDEYYSTAPSDNYIRMKAQDPDRWSYFDDYGNYDSYYSPGSSWGLSAGYGFGYPSYGFGYGMGFGYGYPMYGYGLSYGLGLGFGNPYFGWNSYFLWNTCYNPYFYNPYYGGGAIVVKGNGSYANNMYTHLRAFDGTSYRNSLTARVTNSNNRVYRPASNVYTRDMQNGSGTRLTNSNGNYNNNRSSNGNYYRPSSSNNSVNTNSL